MTDWVMFEAGRIARWDIVDWAYENGVRWDKYRKHSPGYNHPLDATTCKMEKHKWPVKTPE